jgi:hypothetical protein
MKRVNWNTENIFLIFTVNTTKNIIVRYLKVE